MLTRRRRQTPTPWFTSLSLALMFSAVSSLQDRSPWIWGKARKRTRRLSLPWSCTVAPAVMFYRVYECGSTDGDAASWEVDTSAAGANIMIADGTENTIRGSYVARIYDPESVTLSEDGTEVEDAKKLHKYDGAFYSRMSMNVSGGAAGTGVLNIYGENEGLDTELHLTIQSGVINIFSGNDGINTNEDGVSVTTINGGALSIQVTGETGEGDGIDSNGYLVINGGTVTAAAFLTTAYISA